jgi:hypothetical protein
MHGCVYICMKKFICFTFFCTINSQRSVLQKRTWSCMLYLFWECTHSRIYFRSCAASGRFIFTPAEMLLYMHAAFLAAAALLFICFPVCSAVGSLLDARSHRPGILSLIQQLIFACERQFLNSLLAWLVFWKILYSGVPCYVSPIFVCPTQTQKMEIKMKNTQSTPIWQPSFIVIFFGRKIKLNFIICIIQTAHKIVSRERNE